MTERLHELLEQTAGGPAPASRLAAEELFAAGRRRHRRRRRAAFGGAAAAAILAVAALGATSVVTTQPPQGESPAYRGASVVREEPRPGVGGAGATIQWAGAADAKHIYLVYLHCASAPCRKDSFDVVGSDDGGHTWSDRTTGLRAIDWQVVGPATLLATSTSARELVASVDGGRTWSGLATRSSVGAVPDGGTLICSFAKDQSLCRPHAVDPRAGWLAPLSTQLPLRLDQSASIVDVGNRLWVTGTDPATGRPAVAVSVDRGRKWSAHVFAEPRACSSVRCGAPSLATADGRTVYVMIGDAARLQRFVYRSNDGRSWSRLDTDNVPSYREPGWSFVVADGSHVACVMVQRGQDVDECQFWAAKGGDGYQRTQLDGLPTPVHQVKRTPDGWFYAVSYAPTSTLYGSRDGLHWSRVAGG